MSKWCAARRAALSVALVWCLATAPAASQPMSFQDGDVVVRAADNLQLYRDHEKVATWGQSWTVGADDRGNVWAGWVDGNSLVLRQYSSTTEYTEHHSQMAGDDLALHKILYRRGTLYLVYSRPHEEDAVGPWEEDTRPSGRVSGRWVHLLPFSVQSASFAGPIPLKDQFGRAEIIVKSRKLTDGKPIPKGVRDGVLELILFDATIMPAGELWLSTQGKLTSYRIGGLPTGLLELLDPMKIEGFGQRARKIDWWVSRHGNGTGVTALSDTELVVVNGNPPGWLTLVNTDNPEASSPLCRDVFGDDPAEWGLRPVLVAGNEILVGHSHVKVARGYRVSRSTGEVLGIFGAGVSIRGLARISK